MRKIDAYMADYKLQTSAACLDRAESISSTFCTTPL